MQLLTGTLHLSKYYSRVKISDRQTSNCEHELLNYQKMIFISVQKISIILIIIILNLYPSLSFWYCVHKYQYMRNIGLQAQEDEIDDRVGGPVGPLPSVSSKINFQEINLSPSIDLWVVGTGTLGELIAARWRQLNPDATIVTETKTMKRHGKLLADGFVARTRDERMDSDTASCKNVMICIPPSANVDYDKELNDATRLWAGPGYGNILFTSSTAVYGETQSVISEDFRIDTRSARSTMYVYFPFGIDCVRV